MTTENSVRGTLSVDDAAKAIMARAAEASEEDATETETEEADVEEFEFEDEEAEELDASEDDDESEEVDDDEATVEGDTAEEIDAEELNKGYMRQSDYTRKTQELAAERQQVETLKAQAERQLTDLQKAVVEFSVPTQQEPDWVELAQTMKPADLKQKQGQWVQEQAKREQATELKQRIDEVTHEQTRQKEATLLLDRIPEWRDPKIQEADLSEIIPVAAAYGISVEELGAIVDHRQIAALRDLALSKRGEKAASMKKAKLRKKPAAGAAPSKSNPTEKANRDLTARLRKSGSVDDAAALLLHRATAAK